MKSVVIIFAALLLCTFNLKSGIPGNGVEGTLILYSVPKNIRIQIASLGIDSKKDKDEWKAEGIPSGTYKCVFSQDEKEIQGVLEIVGNQENVYTINILAGTIIRNESTSLTQIKISQQENSAINDHPNQDNPSKSFVANDILVDSRDGKQYRTVKIANKLWMKDNLNYEVEQNYYYGSMDYYQKYGRLYEYQDALKACPDGWRLPTLNDWDEALKTVADQKKTPKGKPSWFAFYLEEQVTNHENLDLKASFDIGEKIKGIRMDGGFWTARDDNTFLKDKRQSSFIVRLSEDNTHTDFPQKVLFADFNNRETVWDDTPLSVRCIKDE